MGTIWHSFGRKNLCIIHHAQMYHLYSTIEVWKLKSQEYKKDDLHSTFTLTVRVTGTPTPLSAVHRYVPFALLWISLRTYFPSTAGSGGALSVLLPSTFVQVMFGIGIPVALQFKVTKEPSQTTWSPVTWAIPGDTTKIIFQELLVCSAGKQILTIWRVSPPVSLILKRMKIAKRTIKCD